MRDPCWFAAVEHSLEAAKIVETILLPVRRKVRQWWDQDQTALLPSTKAPQAWRNKPCHHHLQEKDREFSVLALCCINTHKNFNVHGITSVLRREPSGDIPSYFRRRRNEAGLSNGIGEDIVSESQLSGLSSSPSRTPTASDLETQEVNNASEQSNIEGVRWVQYSSTTFQFNQLWWKDVLSCT